MVVRFLLSCRFLLFITSMAHFSMPNSIPISWLYILTVCIKVFKSLSFLANSLMSSMYIKWLIFSSDLLSFYPAAHFLWMWLDGIIVTLASSNFSCENTQVAGAQCTWLHYRGRSSSEDYRGEILHWAEWSIFTCQTKTIKDEQRKKGKKKWTQRTWDNKTLRKGNLLHVCTLYGDRKTLAEILSTIKKGRLIRPPSAISS